MTRGMLRITSAAVIAGGLLLAPARRAGTFTNF